jgi:transposase
VPKWNKKKHREYSRKSRRKDRELHNDYQYQSSNGGLNSGETFSEFRKKKKKHNIF